VVVLFGRISLFSDIVTFVTFLSLPIIAYNDDDDDNDDVMGEESRRFAVAATTTADDDEDDALVDTRIIELKVAVVGENDEQ